MGQYHYLVNLDKREFVHPHEVGNGLKLWEQTTGNLPAVLIALLAVSSGRGGGDFNESHNYDPHANPDGIVGRWGGDRIAIVGDYVEASDLPAEFGADTIQDRCIGEGDHDPLTYLQEDLSTLEAQPFPNADHAALLRGQIAALQRLPRYTNISALVRRFLEAELQIVWLTESGWRQSGERCAVCKRVENLTCPACTGRYPDRQEATYCSCPTVAEAKKDPYGHEWRNIRHRVPPKRALV